jgi:hypothetical protein
VKIRVFIFESFARMNLYFKLIGESMRKIWLRFSDPWWKNVSFLGVFTWNVPMSHRTAYSSIINGWAVLRRSLLLCCTHSLPSNRANGANGANRDRATIQRSSYKHCSIDFVIRSSEHCTTKLRGETTS